MEETINWLDSGIVCAARQERRKEGMPPGMFGSLKKKSRKNKKAQEVVITSLSFSEYNRQIVRKFHTEIAVNSLNMD